jgi:hypothetical protein
VQSELFHANEVLWFFLLCELEFYWGIERPLTSPDGTEEGMVAVNVLMPREVKLKGLKEAPHSAIYKKSVNEKKNKIKE